MADPRETLARIRKQADAATPGPWEHEPPPGPGEDPMRPICVYPKEDGGTLAYVQPLEADAEFIAAARTDVPWLLDQVESRDKALDAALRLADQMEAEDAAMHDFYGWPRTTTGRTDTPSERIRAAIITTIEGETP